MMGVVHYLQTHGFRGARYPNHRLAWVAPHIGIREGRRVEALYQLTADDILAGRHFADGVAVGSYHTDYHWPTVVQRAGTGVTVQCPPHQIPLRAMRPRGATNLLVPGRCLGGDHLATSSFRVMGTCAQTGFAAGVAAAMGTPSRSVDAVDVPKLRARLRRAGVRLDLAPYYSYLRRRRGYEEQTGAVAAPVSALAVTELATGEVLIAYTAERRRWVCCAATRSAGTRPWTWAPWCRRRPLPSWRSPWPTADATGPSASSGCRRWRPR